MITVLAPGGGLAATIPHYEDRPEQRAMAARIGGALRDRQPLIVEAGTGTGKTLAYLVAALGSGLRVVISTGTRALQDQIARHDIPLLRTLSERPFNAVVLKGVANYVCRRRLHESLQRSGSPELVALTEWSRHSATGDRAEVDWLAEDAEVWSEATTTPDARLGHRCPFAASCFVSTARRAAEDADLILVNHHLYFADLALRAAHPAARLLPDHDAVIFDEAHQLEAVATDHFGARVTSLRLGELVRDAAAAFADGSASGAIARVTEASAELFAAVRATLTASHGHEHGRIPLPGDLLLRRDTQAAWLRLDTALELLGARAGEHIDNGPGEEPREDLALLVRRIAGLRDDLTVLAEQRAGQYVYWGELRGAATFLHASPIDVATLIRRHVLEAPATPIFTSATLSVAGSFEFFRRRIGADQEVAEASFDSPFDYPRQTMLYVPRDLPLPGEPGFAAAVAKRIGELLAISGGRAFCLFTSHKTLREVAQRLRGSPWPLLVQGDKPRMAMIESFRDTPGAVLLGAASFWEGIDVPGDALSLVVIDKLPFAPHTDPLVAARAEHAAARGDDPFVSLQLPDAAISLRQGFGRLIRRRDDRGIVAVLDGRMVHRQYGRVLFASLPAKIPRTSSIEQARRWWMGSGSGPGTGEPT